MLFSTAFAQTAAGGGSDFQSTLQQFLPLILIAGVFYFLLIRPQQQRAKQLKTAVAALRRGDKIVTAGGIIASISRVINEEEIEAEIAPGVKARILRSTVTTILSKPEPAKGGKSADVTTKVIEGEIEEIDATADANASGSKKRRAPTKTAAAKAAAEAKPVETATHETATEAHETAPAETKPTDGAN